MKYDVAVVGAGISGLWVALNLKKKKAVIVAPKGEELSNTFWAQGGIAAALDIQDSPLIHYEDTLKVGRGLNDKRAVIVLTHYAPVVMNMLIGKGFKFNPYPHLEAGHSIPRVWNVGDETGRKLLEFLISKASDIERIYSKVVKIEKDKGKVAGVYVDDGRFIEAENVVMATGGYASLWKTSTNPETTTGEGILMAALSGAVLSDLEFVQFHPTVIPENPPILLTEALRGAGAKVVDESGKEIANPLLPRDELARIIYRFNKKYGKVFLDISGVDIDRFPLARGVVKKFGYKVPIYPAAHYSIGGIRVNIWGRTGIKGLWAVGECSNTGVHGANRLASNSLIEGLVFGYRVALDIENNISDDPEFEFIETFEIEYSDGECDPDNVRECMDAFVSVERDKEGLEEAINRLEKCGGIGNLARAISVSSLWRKESRGVHCRKDYPFENPKYLGRLGIRFV